MNFRHGKITLFLKGSDEEELERLLSKARELIASKWGDDETLNKTDRWNVISEGLTKEEFEEQLDSANY